MSRIRAFRYLFCFVLLFTMLGGLMGVPVLAVQENDDSPVVMPPNQEEPPAEDVIDFRCDYPILQRFIPSMEGILRNRLRLWNWSRRSYMAIL